MSITYVASTSSDAFTDTSRAVSDPAGTQENDFYVVMCSIVDDLQTGTWATPAGWTKLTEEHTATSSSDLLQAVFYRFRGASAVGSTTFTTSTTTASQIVVTCSAYRGVDTTTPFDVTYATVSHYISHHNDSLVANQPITTVTNDALVLLYWTGSGSTTTIVPGQPSGYALDFSVGNRNNCSVILASKTVATAGTETPGVWTHTNYPSFQASYKYTLALRPATVAASLYPDMEPLYSGAVLLANKTDVEYSVWLGTAFNTEPDASGVNGTIDGLGVFQFPGAGFAGVATDPAVVALYWEEGTNPVVDRSIIVKTTLVEV